MQCNKLTSGKRVHFDTRKYHEIALQASNRPHDLLNIFPCLI